MLAEPHPRDRFTIFLCARVDSNHHHVYTGQGPQPDTGRVYQSQGGQIVHSELVSGRIGRVWRVDVLKNVLTGGANSWIVGRMLYGLGMTETEVIVEIGRRLAVAVPVGSQVVLFGSRATGLADEGSDYDVLVIEPAVENHVEESVRLRGELDDLRSPIDVIVFAEDVARRRAAVRGTVVDRALREGRVLAHT